MRSDFDAIPYQHEAPWKAQSRLVRQTLVQDSLIMFLDLGLTPWEMSKVAGFSLVEVEEGLKRLESDRKATARRRRKLWDTSKPY